MGRSRKNLYIVYAGTQSEGCIPVYKTTKRNNAENYLHKVVMKDEHYTKAFIECVITCSYDKRTSWKEVD